MSARDDYPLRNDTVGQWADMCDEIDELRNDYQVMKARDDVRGNEVVRLARILNQVKAALDEYDRLKIQK